MFLHNAHKSKNYLLKKPNFFEKMHREYSVMKNLWFR